MLTVIAWICVIVSFLTGLWLTPLRLPVLRRLVCLRHLSCLYRYLFSCKVDVLVDETQSFDADMYFRVQMIGRVPIPHDETDTNLCVELTDITEGRARPEPVLSADEQYRCAGKAEFHYCAHNGIIPHRNAVIYPWKPILEVAAAKLLFARRGRRKLLFKIAILESQTDVVLAEDQCVIEYVSHRDGFLELQERKMELLKASIELAVRLGATEYPLNPPTQQVFERWLSQKAESFPPALELSEWLGALEPSMLKSIPQAIDFLLGRGEQADKQAAVELALQVCAAGPEITEQQFNALSDTVDQLKINRTRFLALCQKILLFSDCRLQVPALLLGIDETMDQETFRLRLNEEYRKWNARVTHPDERIRRRADSILSLIAELRSRRMMVDAVD